MTRFLPVINVARFCKTFGLPNYFARLGGILMVWMPQHSVSKEQSTYSGHLKVFSNFWQPSPATGRSSLPAGRLRRWTRRWTLRPWWPVAHPWPSSHLRRVPRRHPGTLTPPRLVSPPVRHKNPPGFLIMRRFCVLGRLIGKFYLPNRADAASELWP